MSPNVSIGHNCRKCGKFVVSQGIAQHEKACLLIEIPQTDDYFIKSMPEDLSFRDELDLEKESKQENRISHKKRKRTTDLSLEEEQEETKIKATTAQNIQVLESSKAKAPRYSPSKRKECPYCHRFFVSQGFKPHVAKCIRIHQAEVKKQIENTDPDESDITDDYVYEGNQNSVNSNSNSENSGSRSGRRKSGIPCRFCGTLFSKFGIKNHERRCKNRGEHFKNHKSPVVADDTSVDSVESGCRICGFDDDHANLLLCEGCDTEVHTYCLTPPLEKVPTGDWFCDSCKLRMGKAEEEFGMLLKNIPPQMVERFGEVCFAKSAEYAHWWPALIFDPRSFLHNREVVELARRNLGKRFLVFFFENQDAFAAIPEKWILTWNEAVKKQYDEGKSVQNASMDRKLQFQRAMDLAREALEDVSSKHSVPDTMEFDSPVGSDIEEEPLPLRIPRIIGGSSDIVFGTFTDKKPIGRRSRLAAKANNASNTNSKVDHILQSKEDKSPKPQSVSESANKNVDSPEEKPSPRPMPPPLPPLSDQERNELLLNTPFSQYYILPLSQL